MKHGTVTALGNAIQVDDGIVTACTTGCSALVIQTPSPFKSETCVSS